MFRFIFSDDIILAIKDSSKLELYLIKGSDFTNLIEENSYDIDSLLTILNRWEGNSIRIDREKLIATTSRKILLDFSILNNNIMKEVNDFDMLLHTNYIKFFQDTNNQYIKDEIFLTLNDLFKNFEKNYGELS